MAKQPEPELLAPGLPTDGQAKDPLNGDVRATSVPIAPVDKNEPVVTRKELWSYYGACSASFLLTLCAKPITKCTIMVTMCAESAW